MDELSANNPMRASLAKDKHRRDNSRDLNSHLDRNQNWGNAAKEAEEERLAKGAAEGEGEPPKEAEKPNFGLSGALAKDDRTGNMLNGVLLKFNEPLDAATPTKNWRLYVFKDNDVNEVLHLHRKSYFIIGRDHRIADIHTLHPSCSKQQAVIQFRRIDTVTRDENHNLLKLSEVKPYVMDLESAHGTTLNGAAMEPARYYELLERDVLRFGQSSRDYVLLHEDSAAAPAPAPSTSTRR